MVRSEDDSGLDTLWLLKKMAFLSEKGEKAKQKEMICKVLIINDHEVAAMRSWWRLH